MGEVSFTEWTDDGTLRHPGLGLVGEPPGDGAGLGPVTKSYVDHLLASSASGSYGVLVAAVDLARMLNEAQRAVGSAA